LAAGERENSYPPSDELMPRFNQIDILRAVAVFLVLGRHISSCPAEFNGTLHGLTELWIRGGWIGVDLFFVLSGFLVSGLLFREYDKFRKIDVKRFLVRRGFKIYPAFWLLIAATVGLGLLRGKGLEWNRVLAELFFVQNYFPGVWIHTWSLAVEEHFYILLVSIFFLLARVGKGDPFSVVPVCFAGVAVLCLGMRIVSSIQQPYHYTQSLFPSHLRIDSLFAGVAVAFYFQRYRDKFLEISRRFRILLILVGTMAMVPAFVMPLGSGYFLHTVGFSVLYFGSASVLIAFLGMNQAESRSGKALAYIGSHSYSIYLWHVPVLVWATPVIVSPIPDRFEWPVYAVVYLVGSVLFGVVMANLIEYPVLKIRDRWFPSRSGNIVSDPVPSLDSQDV
jgi:peptidoglycan/LPS O-acetylase OafA/YrhL